MIDTDKAAKALTSFADGPAQDAADAIAQTFEQASDRIANALEKAALSGEFSFRNLAQSIAQDFARNAIENLLIDPLESALFGGAKTSNAQASNSVNVVMNITGATDAKSFQKSQGQISASLARAVAQGQKFI